MRAFSVAMAASITVIIASQLGLPVSSTHIAIGGIFGVGFLREYLDNNDEKVSKLQNEKDLLIEEKSTLKALNKEFSDLDSKENKSPEDYVRITDLYKLIDIEESKIKDAKKHIKTAKKVKYVKRDTVKKIIAAWVITVPAAAVLSAMLFFMIKGIMLP